MKNLLLLFLLLSAMPSFAQSCDSVNTTNKDKFTDRVSIMTKRNVDCTGNVPGTGLRFVFTKVDNDLYFQAVMAAKSLGCLDETSKFYFIFDDGSKQNAANMNDFNCKGQAWIRFAGGKGFKPLQEAFSTKLIRSVRLDAREEHVEVDVDEADAKLLRESFNCLKQTFR
ncbi:MAG TPA: hypothetical protein VEB40_01810 [Flavipsychrobacter sp.]|nr:hypothetical protein [Flavipsychrobacter sp.]